jgi:hypothetical protein
METPTTLSCHLQELEEAMGKGLISDSEYSALRAAVLERFEAAASELASKNGPGPTALDTLVGTDVATHVRRDGYDRGLSLANAKQLANERGAVGFFQSNPGQFHWLYPGGTRYDVRVDKENGYNVTGIWIRLHALFLSIPSIDNARWTPEDGFEKNLTLPEALSMAMEKGAIGLFQSNPNQYHWLFPGIRTFDVRLGPGNYNVTSLWARS